MTFDLRDRHLPIIKPVLLWDWGYPQAMHEALLAVPNLRTLIHQDELPDYYRSTVADDE